MEATSAGGAFSSLLVCSSVFIIPLILGIILLRHSEDGLSRMAGWLTLKPLITTPLWILILGLLYPNPVAGTFLSILPGALLSLIAFVICRPLLKDSRTRGVARRLLILDCARWLNTLAIMLLPEGTLWSVTNGSRNYPPFIVILMIIGFSLPSVFGAFAVYSLSRYEKILAAPAWQKNRS